MDFGHTERARNLCTENGSCHTPSCGQRLEDVVDETTPPDTGREGGRVNFCDVIMTMYVRPVASQSVCTRQASYARDLWCYALICGVRGGDARTVIFYTSRRQW